MNGDSFIIRAGAHAAAPLTLAPAQRWRNGVTDEDVTYVLYAMEAERTIFTRGPQGRWLPPQGKAGGVLRNVDTTTVVREMIRTGLVRWWVDEDGDHLVPARVHLRDSVHRGVSACRTSIEGIVGGRVRLSSDLSVVDCLDCEETVVKGGPRRL